MENKIKVMLALAVIVDGNSVTSEVKVGIPLLHAYPCNGTTDITSSFEVTQNPEENNKYNVYIIKKFPSDAKIGITLSEDASLTLNHDTYANVFKEGKIFEIRFFNEADGVSFEVKGLSYTVPYITSLVINNEEYCSQPFVGYLDQYVKKNENEPQ